MIDKLKAIWKLWKSDEYFLTVANEKEVPESYFGPIKYKYMTNTNRELFYIFIKDYINNLKEVNKLID